MVINANADDLKAPLTKVKKLVYAWSEQKSGNIIPTGATQEFKPEDCLLQLKGKIRASRFTAGLFFEFINLCEATCFKMLSAWKRAWNARGSLGGRD